jgi:hypothetical protein
MARMDDGVLFAYSDLADYLLANGVTVQECNGVEIDQFKLPIDEPYQLSCKRNGG